jgi:hypothetical protein
MARTMARGATRHGEKNWTKGMPVDHCINHAFNHMAKFMEGDTAEEHLAHAMCNLAMAIHFLEQNKCQEV